MFLRDIWNTLGETKEKLKKNSSHTDVLNFLSYLLNCWKYKAEMWNWVLQHGFIRLLEFQLYRTKVKPSSHNGIEGYFTVSPKIFDIFHEILDWRFGRYALMAL
jgi:hypothetical protein